MDSFVFVQIASLCLSDQKDVSLYLTFHSTTLMRAGGQQGWAGARPVVPLSAQRTLGKATTPRPGCPVADPRDTARYGQAGGPRPHPLQSKTKKAPYPLYRAPSHGHLYSTSHSSVGFFQDVP